MEIGLALPQYGYSVPGEAPLRWATVERWADRAVAAGFSSLWVSDHLYLTLDRYGGPPHVRFDCVEPVVAMGALAVRHPQVTVGCLVFCAPLRPPKLLAKQLETLDALSPGRIVAGLGAGWNEAEFAEAGIPFERPALRLGQLVDTAVAARRFLTDGPVPIWFGGKGPRLVDLAVRHADGWNTVWAWTDHDYRQRLAVVERTCEEIGRDPSTFHRSVGLNVLVGEDERDVRQRWRRRQEAVPDRMFDQVELDEWRVGRLVGTVDEVREQAATWRELGVSLLVVNLGALPFSVTDPDDLDLVASALL